MKIINKKFYASCAITRFRMKNYYINVILQNLKAKKMQKSSKFKQIQDTSKNFPLRFAHLTKIFVPLFRKGIALLRIRHLGRNG